MRQRKGWRGAVMTVWQGPFPHADTQATFAFVNGKLHANFKQSMSQRRDLSLSSEYRKSQECRLLGVQVPQRQH